MMIMTGSFFLPFPFFHLQGKSTSKFFLLLFYFCHHYDGGGLSLFFLSFFYSFSYSFSFLPLFLFSLFLFLSLFSPFFSCTLDKHLLYFFSLGRKFEEKEEENAQKKKEVMLQKFNLAKEKRRIFVLKEGDETGARFSFRQIFSQLVVCSRLL